jgi:hypothetical protein
MATSVSLLFIGTLDSGGESAAGQAGAEKKPFIWPGKSHSQKLAAVRNGCGIRLSGADLCRCVDQSLIALRLFRT